MNVLEHIQKDALSWECNEVLKRIELVNCATLGLSMPERYYPIPGDNSYEDTRWGIQILAQKFIEEHQDLIDGSFKAMLPTEIKVGDKIYLGNGRIATITGFAPNWWSSRGYQISFWADVEPKTDAKNLKVNLNATNKKPLYISLW